MELASRSSVGQEALARLTQAERFLAEASIEDLADVAAMVDLAEAARVYADRARLGTHSINYATEVKLKAEFKMADLVDAGQAAGQIASPGQPSKVLLGVPTLLELGIKASRLSEARTLRDGFTAEQIERRVAEATDAETEVSRHRLLAEARSAAKLEAAQNMPDALPIPEHTFTTIEADPPWFIPSGDKGPGYQYPMMELDDIKAITFNTTPNAHLYLWATNTHLDDALEVCEAWGFTYRTVITWVKPRIGLGHHFRTSTEHIIFGVKGKLDTLVNDQRTHFEAPAGRHSAKPAEAYDIIERCSPGPYLRLFARDEREGWTSWGNEL